MNTNTASQLVAFGERSLREGCWRMLLVVTYVTSSAAADDWHSWRGPVGDGRIPDAAPTEWGAQQSIRWKAALPSGSNSSPVVSGGRVFVTAADRTGATGSLIAFDREDGKPLWQQKVEFKGRESTHSTNPYCSASPVTDGEVVCASFGSAGLLGCTTDGELLWRTDLGKLEHVFGNASSPVLFRDLCVLWCGPGSRQFVLAVDKRTGEEVWRHEVPGGKPDFNAPSDCVGSWATPIIASVAGRTQLILNAPEELMSLDPRTGKKLWYSRGIGKLAYGSPVIWKDTVVAMSGYHGPVLAVRATGVGDVTNTHQVWAHDERQPQRIGSPLAKDGRLYCVNENGTAVCLDLQTGKSLFAARNRVCGQTWSSLVQAGGKLYIASLSGDVTVLNGDLSVVARNRLPDRIASSPAVSKGEIFIRGYDYLYCIADGD